MAQVFKRFNLSVVTRKYTDNEGKEKSNWERIGQMTTFKRDDGSYSSIIELFHMPGVTISVFEQKPKESAPPAFAGGSGQQANNQLQQNEEINIQDIPF
jgi:hypothetical protein